MRLLFLLLLLPPTLLLAQERCGSAEKLQKQLATNPNQQGLHQQIEQKIVKWKEKRNSTNNITIPVVFHVVYKNNTEDISQAQILSQLEVINEDFRRQNIDAINTPAEFASVAADTEINFCLAQRTPENNITSGITRTETNVSSFSLFDDRIFFDSLGGKDIWNSDLYLNIYVCDLSSVLGFAAFPSSNPAIDGVVIDYENFGNTGTVSPPYHKGRTCTHEIGHWLNLIHVWGDMNCGDDFVNDTPEQAQENYGCPAHPSVSCSNNGDMFQNYMDYTNDACMNLFTQGQKNRMHATLNSTREGLLNSKACLSPYEDIGISDITSLNENVFCGSEMDINVTLKNYSNQEITSAIISYVLDNNPVVEVNWNGSLNALESTNLSLGTEVLSSGMHQLKVFTSYPNDYPDVNNANDTLITSFDVIDGSFFQINVFTDNYGEEVSWEIIDDLNNLIASQTNLLSNQSNNSEICLPSDSCFTFVINDAYNDGICCDFGNGYVSINGVYYSGNYGSSTSVDLCDLNSISDLKKEMIRVFPNPSKGNFVFSSLDNIEHIQVLSFNGSNVFEQEFNQKTVQLDLHNLEAGIYVSFITINNNNTQVYKLVIY